MNKEQTLRIVALLSSGWNIKFDSLKTEIYGENLADLDYKQCQLAVKILIQTSEFLPSVANLRKTYIEIENKTFDSATAYSILKNAICTYGFYEAKEALKYIKSQNETVYELVNKLGWRILCMCPEAILSSKFMKTYQEFSQEKIKNKVISQKLLSQINSIREEIEKEGFKLLEDENFG